MPLQAIENRVSDTLLALLAGIGTPASGWLSAAPMVVEGAPGDAIPEPSAVAAAGKSGLLYVEHTRTGPAEGEAGTATHTMQVDFTLTVAVTTLRAMRNLKADVLRALWAGEGAMTTAHQCPMWATDFTVRDDLRPSGYFAGSLSAFITTTLAHDAP